MQQLDLFGYMEQEKKSAEQKADLNGSKIKVAIAEEADEKINPQTRETNEVVDKLPQKISQPPIEAETNSKTKSKRGRKSYKEIDAAIINVSLPDEEELFKKQYYSISEVAGWFNVNTSLIRFWENEFEILKPRKTRKGNRLFRPEDVKNIQLIYYLLRQRKYSIEGAKKFLKENKNKADTQMQLIQLLTKFKSFLLEWKANLEI